MTAGKQIRLQRILGKNNRCIIVPMDHGVTNGPVAGLEDIANKVKLMAHAGAEAVVIHKGIIKYCSSSFKSMALIMHLSGASSFQPYDGNSKVLIASVEEAIRMGADAVSIHVTLGDPAEREMLRDFGKVSEAAFSYGMPLLAMMYVRGPGIDNPKEVNALKHAARIAAELGADLVKIPYCGSSQALQEIVSTCPIPILLAGGSKTASDLEVLSLANACIEAGAAGLSIGRNIFQHIHPERILAALHGIIHEGHSINDAAQWLHTNN